MFRNTTGNISINISDIEQLSSLFKVIYLNGDIRSHPYLSSQDLLILADISLALDALLKTKTDALAGSFEATSLERKTMQADEFLFSIKDKLEKIISVFNANHDNTRILHPQTNTRMSVTQALEQFRDRLFNPGFIVKTAKSRYGRMALQNIKAVKSPENAREVKLPEKAGEVKPPENVGEVKPPEKGPEVSVKMRHVRRKAKFHPGAFQDHGKGDEKNEEKNQEKFQFRNNKLIDSIVSKCAEEGGIKIKIGKGKSCKEIKFIERINSKKNLTKSISEFALPTTLFEIISIQYSALTEQEKFKRTSDILQKAAKPSLITRATRDDTLQDFYNDLYKNLYNDLNYEDPYKSSSRPKA